MKAPKWIRVCPIGRFAGRDRRVFFLGNPRQVIRASRLPLPVDVEHRVTNFEFGAREVGWLVELEARPDAIWGRVSWMPEGRRLVESGAYPSISPAFVHDKARRVINIEAAAIVKVPNLFDMSISGVPDAALSICAELGLSPDAFQRARQAQTVSHDGSLLYFDPRVSDD